MKRLLVLAVLLHAAPAHAICERLDVTDREIDLDDPWVAAPAPDGTGDELWNKDLTDMHAIVRVEGPSPDACASWPAAMGKGIGWKEVATRPARFDDRYDRFWEQPRIGASAACLDTDRGAYLVQVNTALVNDPSDPRLDAIATRVADALTIDVSCWWEETPAPGGCTELPNQARQIDLPGGWRVESTTIDGAPRDELFNDRLTGPWLGSPTAGAGLRGPFIGACADLAFDATKMSEVSKPELYGSRYARVWEPPDAFPIYSGCLDTDRGYVLVDLYLMVIEPSHWDDPGILQLTERVADAMTTAVCASAVAPVDTGPAYGECVTLPVAGRQIDLPDDWALLASGGAPGDHLQSPRFSVGLEIRFVPDGLCYELGYDYGGSVPGMSARYAYFGGDDGIEGGCVEVVGGAWIVDKYGSEAELDDPAWLAATEAVADMIAYDVTCPWEVTTTTGPTTPARRAKERLDASAAFVHSSLPLGSYTLDEVAVHLGAGLGHAMFSADLRLGTGFDTVSDAGLGVGAVFGARTQIEGTASFAVRKLGDDSALGFGLRVAVTQQLPKRCFALGVVEARWISTRLELTVPPAHTEQGPLELEPNVFLGGGWRFLYAGFESRALAHYDQRTYGVVLGVRYQN